MNRIIQKALFLLLFAGLTVLVSPVATKVYAAPCSDFDKTILGVPTWYKYLEGEQVSGKCKPIINTSEDVLPIGLAVFEGALVLGGIIAALMVFVGGFKYVLAQGEPDKAAGGRKTVINALVGLVITIIAARIVSFIAGSIT